MRGLRNLIWCAIMKGMGKIYRSTHIAGDALLSSDGNIRFRFVKKASSRLVVDIGWRRFSLLLSVGSVNVGRLVS